MRRSESALRPLLRRAQERDAEGVARLLGELGYECSATEAGARIAAIGRESSQVLIVADMHGELCGLLALDVMYFLPLGCNTCRITALIVGEGYRDFGVGRALLKEAEQRARQAGAARIEVTAAEHRHRAHDFYRAGGYSESALRFLKHLGDA